jgi:single-stranded-DNA-specific exonuclease
MSRLRWRLLSLPPLPEWREVMEAFGVGPEAALALWRRGVRRKEDLDPPLRLLPLKGLEEAVDLLLKAIREGKRIRVHGDYDADGLTGTAILVRGLTALGARVHPFIPHRLEEGYGVLMERVPEHLEAAEVFLTVDCGIANHAELKELVENGVEVLVTDHHTPKEAPPPGVVLHPAYTPGLGEHPTGAGWPSSSSLPFTRGLACPLPWSTPTWAALGTIADVAPLWGWTGPWPRRAWPVWPPRPGWASGFWPRPWATRARPTRWPSASPPASMRQAAWGGGKGPQASPHR